MLEAVFLQITANTPLGCLLESLATTLDLPIDEVAARLIGLGAELLYERAARRDGKTFIDDHKGALQ